MITKEMLKDFKEQGIDEVAIRSNLTCETEGWVCQKCYGIDLGYNELVAIGTPVWIIAAQSIWEPGTQLTMRTFHSGWVAKEGWDITQGLTRVEELFEARSPKYESIVAPFNGKITEIKTWEKEIALTIVADILESKEYYLPDQNYKVMVKKWDKIEEKQILAKSQDWKSKITSLRSWKVDKIDENMIVIKDIEPQVATYWIEYGKNIVITEWASIEIWDKITEWHINIQKLMELAGPLKTQSYIVNDIKEIYSSQGQTVNSKHIELIVRQMFSKIKITNAWDTSFFPWDIVDIIKFKKENDDMIKTGWRQAIWSQLLLGLTKISLFTDSWLSAASFQETVRVLVEASVSKKIDKLDGLKENVIIGRLIPTLKYYNNNKNVWSFYEDDELDAAEVREEKWLEDDLSYEDYANLN